MTRAGASRSRSIRADRGRCMARPHDRRTTSPRHDDRATFDSKRHGGFYTQDDVREIVAYARERFVDVVPEIEMPGHSQAAIAAYPMLGNFGDTIKPWTMWGVTQLHPQSVGHDHRVHAGRAHRGDGALSGTVHPHRRRRGDRRPNGKRARARRQIAIDQDDLGTRTTENELQSWFITTDGRVPHRRTGGGWSAGTRSSRAGWRRTRS